jgi:hypothetical protein
MKKLILVVLLLSLCFFLTPVRSRSQEFFFRKATVTVSPDIKQSFVKDGRLLIHFTRQRATEPRLRSEITVGVSPKNWDNSAPFVVETKNSDVNVYGLEKWKVQTPGMIYFQTVYKQNTDDGQENVPGNLFSNVDSVALTSNTELNLTLNKIIPPYEIVDNKFVKTVVIKSKSLSEFSGHPRYLKASVLLPSGYFENPGKSYPICYRAPGLNGRYNAVNRLLNDKEFSTWWFSGSAPQIIYVFLDSQGPYGDTYQVDSENNGPCGKALTEELIPEIERLVHYNPDSKLRFLAGCSTGGWVSLGLQILYPDFFDGTWSYSPDPVDFEHYGLINIYEDESIFYNRFGYLQPGSRTIYGEPTRSMKDWITGENVVSITNDYRISGGQFGAYNAVFGPKGNDSLPTLMFDPVSGKIDHSIAKQWEKYDLKKILEKNWATLGPKLQGKIWIWTGDMDGLYSNVATRFLKTYLDKTENPKSHARISFTPMAGHCQEWSDKAVLEMISEKAKSIIINYVDSFENVNHPQVAYWFFAANMMPEERYKGKIDTFAMQSKYTLIFLTERDGCNFYDTKTMHPVFEKLVAYAHQKGLKIGLQIWKRDFGTLPENTDRLVQEGEVMLDENGHAGYSVKAKGAREMNTLIKSELLKIYAFKKTADGFYNPATLKEITSSAKVHSTVNEVSLTIDAGSKLKGYTAYILTQHYYNSCSNFSGQALAMITDAFKGYADIPFDGIGLDEYKNLKIARQPILEQTNDVFRERLYSIGMADKMKVTTGLDFDRLLFDMRYAPEGKPEIRMKAINGYMSLLRTATLGIEAAVYDLGKKLYGQEAFIGLHNTFHNNLDRDEVWQTGVSWWNIKRDYGHTDEETPTPIQLGIGMCYPENAMYNMYYNKSLERIWTKALYDLRFGIRTHYHAANDVQGWGVSIDDPKALEKINQVENAARLLNRFNPSFPHVKLLVVYGMEAMYNWYPDVADRGMYEINDHLGMEKKSVELWNNGYYHASVPTDIIGDGRLTLNASGKPVLNGYVFDAVVFLGPRYSKEPTVKFFQEYVAKGGRLLLDGPADFNYNGKNISDTWKKIASKSVATTYSIDNVAKLGISKNDLTDGVTNGPGTYTFTSIESLQTNKPATFSFTYLGNTYTGTYKGLAAIKIDQQGNLQKLAATSFSTLSKNGKEIIHSSDEADVFITVENSVTKATVADPSKSVKLYLND